MIVVVADDISGAAELAGFAHARGFSAEVQTALDLRTDAEIVALDTDSRTISSAEAVQRVRAAAQAVARAQPSWIYKKTDSVLRGHVRAELTALLQAARQHRILFIPANPERGRVIRKGRYYVNDMPLNETVFALDPQYPAASAEVLDLLLREDGAPVHLLGPTVEAPWEGIGVPDVTSSADLAAWAARADVTQLCAGASEFFGALLEKRTGARPAYSQSAGIESPGSTLFVCGTAAGWPFTARGCQERSIPVLTMPPEALGAMNPPGILSAQIEDWGARVVKCLSEQGKSTIAIGTPPLQAQVPPQSLLGPLVEAVAWVLRNVPVARLWMEGGATAAAVLRRMGWTRFRVEYQVVPGVPLLRVLGETGPTLCIKPGSYLWPEQIWP